MNKDRLILSKRFVWHFERRQDNLRLTVYLKPKTLQGAVQPLQMEHTKVMGWSKMTTQQRKMRMRMLLQRITKRQNRALHAAVNAV